VSLVDPERKYDFAGSSRSRIIERTLSAPSFGPHWLSLCRCPGSAKLNQLR
jgi:hypothetical protein